MTDKKAFTLIEMLIVVAIVAILAMVSVASFGSARQQARRDIAIDSMVSALRGQQTLAKSGRLDEATGLNRCYGMLFKTEEPYAQLVDMPYIAVGTDKADYCDELETDRNVRDYDVIEDFEIRKIDTFGVEDTDVVILFKPPFARTVLGDASFGNLENLVVQTTSDIVVSVALPGDEEVRAFRFDASSGLIERVYESNT